MAEKKQWHETLHDQFGQYFAVDNVLYHEKTDHVVALLFEQVCRHRRVHSSRKSYYYTCHGFQITGPTIRRAVPASSCGPRNLCLQ